MEDLISKGDTKKLKKYLVKDKKKKWIKETFVNGQVGVQLTNRLLIISTKINIY